MRDGVKQEAVTGSRQEKSKSVILLLLILATLSRDFEISQAHLRLSSTLPVQAVRSIRRAEAALLVIDAGLPRSFQTTDRCPSCQVSGGEPRSLHDITDVETISWDICKAQDHEPVLSLWRIVHIPIRKLARCLMD